MKKCPYCTGELEDTVIMCHHCGNSLSIEKDLSNLESPKVFKVVENNIPIAWITFNIYFRIPISMLAIIVQSFLTRDIYSIIISLLICILGIFVVIGLYKRRLFGWILNWIWLILETLILAIKTSIKEGVIDNQSFIIGLIVSSLLWFLPNFLYFKKRESLFN